MWWWRGSVRLDVNVFCVVAPYTHIEVGMLFTNVKRQRVMPSWILGQKKKQTNV